MRTFLIATLAVCALPALAQPDRRVERVVVDVDTVVIGGDHRFEIEIEEEVDADGERVIIRRRGGDLDERIVEVEMPDAVEIETMMQRVLDSPLAVFRSRDGGTVFERQLGLMGGSPETRARMRELETEARQHARRARTADGAERREAEDALYRTLDELFDVRAEARRERAERLRQQAAELQAEADEMEAALADREARRRALIEARRDELMGEDPTLDW